MVFRPWTSARERYILEKVKTTLDEVVRCFFIDMNNETVKLRGWKSIIALFKTYVEERLGTLIKNLFADQV